MDALQIIPIGSKGNLQEAFDVRIDEMNVLDLKFLDDCHQPTLAVLHEDPKSERHIKTYIVDARSTIRASYFTYAIQNVRLPGEGTLLELTGFPILIIKQ